MNACVRGALASLLFAALGGTALAQDAGYQVTLDPLKAVPAAREAAERNSENEGSRVYGGTEAQRGQWPFQVALLDATRLDKRPDSQYYAQFCGGSLIGEEWILTAAHCAADGNGNPYRADAISVLVGATKLTEGSRYRAAEVHVHEGYDPSTIENDIALIKLRRPITNIEPVGLASADANTDAGNATLIGWGRVEDGTTPVNLMQVELGLFPNNTCNAGIKGYFRDGLRQRIAANSDFLRLNEETIEAAVDVLDKGMGDPLTTGMLCAGTQSGERSSCNGDSGGPLMVTPAGGPVQVGVVSWGAGPLDAQSFCGHKDAYSVYTRVSAYRDWIKQISGL